MDAPWMEILPPADEMRALRRATPQSREEGSLRDLAPYAAATARLVKKTAAAGGQGVVIKFRVEDYADEAACGRALARFGKVMEDRGYRCCISYDTYALALRDGKAQLSPMRNPAIIAMTVMW